MRDIDLESKEEEIEMSGSEDSEMEELEEDSLGAMEKERNMVQMMTEEEERISDAILEGVYKEEDAHSSRLDLNFKIHKIKHQNDLSHSIGTIRAK